MILLIAATGLRRYDLDRSVALVEDPKEKPVGFMSHKAKIYLVRSMSTVSRCPAHCVQKTGRCSGPHGLRVHSKRPDVRHLTIHQILSSVDLFTTISENLISYSFNVCFPPTCSVVPLNPVADVGLPYKRDHASPYTCHDYLHASHAAHRLFRESLSYSRSIPLTWLPRE